MGICILLQVIFDWQTGVSVRHDKQLSWKRQDMHTKFYRKSEGKRGPGRLRLDKNKIRLLRKQETRSAIEWLAFLFRIGRYMFQISARKSATTKACPWNFSVPPGLCRNTASTASFHRIFNSWVIYHSSNLC